MTTTMRSMMHFLQRSLLSLGPDLQTLRSVSLSALLPAWLTRMLTTAGVILVMSGTWIPAKALLAQVLLRHAWEQALAGVDQPKPWPWADTTPVAKLLIPTRRFATIVLAGSSGRTMAFGPGHFDGTPLPGESGNSVITAHRDTHFRVLRDLQRGDSIVVESLDGQRVMYRVTEARVVNEKETGLLRQEGGTRLTLVTCYPFDAVVPGGPLRWVVIAVAE